MPRSRRRVRAVGSVQELAKIVDPSSHRISDHQAKLHAHELLREHASDDVGKLAGLLYDAQVEPKPHQIDAALFALGTPFLRGVILADEVGLGKTIEAGIVISQAWAERRRSILVVVPASLRQQWQQELAEKFLIPSVVLDSANRDEWLEASASPSRDPRVLICSYEFVHANVERLQLSWDLFVADEAHRVRNLHTGRAKIAKSVASVARAANKVVFMTATPLQNRLEELWGLVSAFDPEYFGSLDAFRARYCLSSGDTSLPDRVSLIAKRTLRRDADRYIHFTERHSATFEFDPAPGEQEVYRRVEEYLHREHLNAFGSAQRSLVEMVIRKRLGSSTRAVAKTLTRVADRLEADLDTTNGPLRDLQGVLGDEITSDVLSLPENEPLPGPSHRPQSSEVREEIQELRSIVTTARSVPMDAKVERLLDALREGFSRLEEVGAPRKAIVFTESVETQMFLAEILEANGFGEGLVLFNGSNDTPREREIYRHWLEDNQGSDVITGVASADIRKALVEHFRTHDGVMIATEAASEGINLQFCSMLVNYDLPWNPQRVEQRIGRVHRFGQKHNVIVANFLNRGNTAERRVLELLTDKFQLFSSIFGASDEVLGNIEDGLGFERAVASILSNCRTEEELEAAFHQLEADHADEINQEMARTRNLIFEGLDPRVQDRLRTFDNETGAVLNRFERLFLAVTRHELDGIATFQGDGRRFTIGNLDGVPDAAGRYYFKSDPVKAAKRYRVSSDLGQHVLHSAANRETGAAHLFFSIADSPRVSSSIRRLAGQSGTLKGNLLELGTQGDQGEEMSQVLISSISESGEALDQEDIEDLLDLTCIATQALDEKINTEPLDQALTQEMLASRKAFEERNVEYHEKQHQVLRQNQKDREAEFLEQTRVLQRRADEAFRQVDREDNATRRLQLRRKARRFEDEAADLEDEMRSVLRELRRRSDSVLDRLEEALTSSASSTTLVTIKWTVLP